MSCGWPTKPCNTCDDKATPDRHLRRLRNLLDDHERGRGAHVGPLDANAFRLLLTELTRLQEVERQCASWKRYALALEHAAAEAAKADRAAEMAPSDEALEKLRLALVEVGDARAALKALAQPGPPPA